MPRQFATPSLPKARLTQSVRFRGGNRSRFPFAASIPDALLLGVELRRLNEGTFDHAAFKFAMAGALAMASGLRFYGA